MTSAKTGFPALMCGGSLRVGEERTLSGARDTYPVIGGVPRWSLKWTDMQGLL